VLFPLFLAPTITQWGEYNGPLGIFIRIEIRVTCWADVFANHSPVSDAKRSVRRSDIGETIENLQFAIHFIQSHLVFWRFFLNEKAAIALRANLPLSLLLPPTHRLNYAIIRHNGRRTCGRNGALLQSRCDASTGRMSLQIPRDRKIGKQRKNERERKNSGNEMDLLWIMFLRRREKEPQWYHVEKLY